MCCPQKIDISPHNKLKVLSYVCFFSAGMDRMPMLLTIRYEQFGKAEKETNKRDLVKVNSKTPLTCSWATTFPKDSDSRFCAPASSPRSAPIIVHPVQ